MSIKKLIKKSKALISMKTDKSSIEKESLGSLGEDLVLWLR